MRLNLGCGQNPVEGWTNVDWIAGPGVDLVVDLERGLPMVQKDSVTDVLASHLIEHINDPLAMMQNLHDVCIDGALATFACPYGSSDDADEDPTHVRRMFLNSWAYFAQPTYWRGNTDYQGDWQLQQIELRVAPETWAMSEGMVNMDRRLDDLYKRVMRARNVVQEMVATLRCVKPARPRDRTLGEGWKLLFEEHVPPSQPVVLGVMEAKGYQGG